MIYSDADLNNIKISPGSEVGTYASPIIINGDIVEESIDISDKISPVITLFGPSYISHEVGNKYVDSGVNATDERETDVVITTSGQ